MLVYDLRTVIMVIKIIFLLEGFIKKYFCRMKKKLEIRMFTISMHKPFSREETLQRQLANSEYCKAHFPSPNTLINHCTLLDGYSFKRIVITMQLIAIEFC